MRGMPSGERASGISQVWLARIGGALAMAVILFLLLLRYYVEADTPFGLSTLVLLLPAGFILWVFLEWATRPLLGRISRTLLRMQTQPVEFVRVRGVCVLVDQTCLLPPLAALPGILAAPAAGVAAFLTYYAVLLVHEYGHALVATRQGCQVYAIELHAFHGVTIFSVPPDRRSHVLIAWGGVAGQTIVAAPASIALILVPPAAPDPLLACLIVLGPVSLFWAAVNLLPVHGLDGALAWQYFRPRQSRTSSVSRMRPK